MKYALEVRLGGKLITSGPVEELDAWQIWEETFDSELPIQVPDSAFVGNTELRLVERKP